MTRLYYTDSFLSEFDARVVELVTAPRPAVVLDRTAFYPTSGGQVFDTGWLEGNGARLRVLEVAEQDDRILHYLETANLTVGGSVHGTIDLPRRRDHMQQHSGQHVLSAAFIRLFEMPTVSFHMGDEACTIDLDTKAATAEQVEKAEDLANQIVMEDRPVEVRFVNLEEARGLGLRKLPPVEREQLRLIDIRDFDLTACGGTHVRSTGQIGAILVRKTEKVRQGVRVEFVCGGRALAAARRDRLALNEAASVLSAHIWEVPQQVRKTQEEARAARKLRSELLNELAELHAARLLQETPEANGFHLVVRTFPDRDLEFIKLLAQKLVRSEGKRAVALLGSGEGSPALVFAQTAGLPFDMGALMKEALAASGGRGGGTRDMAQGGVARAEQVSAALERVLAKLKQGFR
ncbi:MAG TPA: DHHA1 domain-containing protein [Terriglobales bacterium]|nr:DHHA1 domain-containing protein [Terriglobales bacterium]